VFKKSKGGQLLVTYPRLTTIKGISAKSADDIIAKARTLLPNYQSTFQTRTECISTGCSAIDRLLQGGVAKGTLTEVFGPPKVGKSTLAHQLLVTTQAASLKSMYISVDIGQQTFKPERITRLTSSL
jgi:RecA/RadA recombinase